MNTALETSIIEHIHRFDDTHKAEVLDFVEYLFTKYNATAPAVNWPLIDPTRDLPRLVGTVRFPEDGVIYQRRSRDSEW